MIRTSGMSSIALSPKQNLLIEDYHSAEDNAILITQLSNLLANRVRAQVHAATSRVLFEVSYLAARRRRPLSK
jgi:hypothetical protein